MKPPPDEGPPTDDAGRAYGGESPFSRSEKRPLLSRAVPVSEELPGYRPHTARRDAVAALTVAALALPSAMAYAEVAGVSPVNGLYPLLAPTLVYALLGTSRQLVIGPEGSISALVGASVIGLAAAGSAEAARRLRRSRCWSPRASGSRGCSGLAGLPTTCRGPCSSATSTASPVC